MGLYQHDVNVVWDLAPHDVSILNYLLGGPPDAASPAGAPGTRTAASRTSRTCGCYYEDAGVEATVHVSWLHPCKTRRVTAVGSDLMVVFDDLATEERIRVHHKSVRQPEAVSDDLSQPPMSYQYGDVVAPYLVVKEPLVVEDQHFVDCITQDVTPADRGRQRPRRGGGPGGGPAVPRGGATRSSLDPRTSRRRPTACGRHRGHGPRPAHRLVATGTLG